MKPGIEWVILVTDNYKEARNFYSEKLGFRILREVPEEQFCQFIIANFFLAIYGRTEFQKLLPIPIGKGGGAVYTFPESTNIDADYAALKAKGVPFITEPTTQAWGQRTAYFKDPDGHIWELQQWLHPPSH